MLKKVLLLSSLATLASFSVAFASAEKVRICHATGSEKNPYKMLNISVNGLHGHDGHDGDFFPDEDASDCTIEEFPS